ncbi:MAG TPA: phosphomannomutase/phosphoglucomutase [Rhodospirillales bacterium]|nr:phosphomannomutase/phosphoglucomutase [Rhodospirillales bacterium]
MLDPSILREYDIRGVVGRTLTGDGVRAIGRAFGTLVVRGGGSSVAVGYDGRLSSPSLEAALVEGLVSTGVTVHRIGLGPTPMLYFAAHHLGAGGGMMITGSHNPPDYNGIKMVLAHKAFYGDAIQQLGRMVATSDFVAGDGAVESVDITDVYLDRLVQDFAPGRALTIAWDPGNGAAGAVLRRLCERLPGRHVLINERVDGTFPAHHPDPTVEENLDDLKACVAEHDCDLGIGFDGDGDRIGVIDADGRVVWGDQLLIILAGPILQELPGATIIADVKSSRVFFEEIERRGGKALMSRTGHSLIKSLLAETGAPLAGEMSGHIFFAHRYFGFDDALYAAVRLLAVAAASKQSIAEMLNALPKMVNTPELRIDCADERKFGVIEEVRARLRGVNGIAVQEIDGVRVNTDDGWWLLRASNTQPVLVGRCEAPDAARLARLTSELARQLSLSGVDAAGVEAGRTGTGH